jgi:hypothetical protein
VSCGERRPVDWDTLKTPSRSRNCCVSIALVFTMLLLIRLAGRAEPQVSPAEGQDQGPYRISVNVNLVALYATVRDRQSGFVSDLREQSFEVYVYEGAEQAAKPSQAHSMTS